MDRSYLRFVRGGHAERITESLEREQFIHPHAPLTAALDAVAGRLGVCPDAGGAALLQLQLDPTRSIGRLRHTELAQLAHTVHRIWRQTLGAGSAQAQPA